MSKIQSISFVNFKAIDKYEADFKGCTAIITSGNGKGKTSFLKGLTDRIRFVRPEIMVKRGEEAGKGEMTLDTGEKFIWEFDVSGKDKLSYIDSKAIKQSVTVALGERFFPPIFDIDKFLLSSPKEQAKQLQKIVGIDFTDVDARYAAAYANRTARNLEAERFHVKLSKMLEVPKVNPVDLTVLQDKKEAERLRLNELYKANKAENKKRRDNWEAGKRVIDEEVLKFNEAQRLKKAEIQLIEEYRDRICDMFSEHPPLKDLIDLAKITEHIKNMPSPEPEKTAATLYPKEPVYIEEMPDDKTLREIDAQILAASEINAEAKKYNDYIEYKAQTEAAQEEAKKADDEVKAIEQERLRLIESAKFPKGILIGPDGITVDGFPLDKNQISSSKLYTTALRIASMSLGEVKTLYFDASYLDNQNLSEIEKWAEENDLQLLIERPDRDGGEIVYHLIEG